MAVTGCDRVAQPGATSATIVRCAISSAPWPSSSCSPPARGRACAARRASTACATSGWACRSEPLIRREGALEKIEPVLAPIEFVPVDVSRRAEDLALDRFRRVGIELVARRGTVGGGDQRRAVEAVFRADRRHRRTVGDVALLRPYRAQQRIGENAGVGAALLRRDDGAGGVIARHRKMLGLEIEPDAEKVAPALELDEAIGLALLRPLAKRQPAGGREDLAVVARFVAQLDAIFACHAFESLAAEIGPGRNRAEEVIDDLAHWILPSGGVLSDGLIARSRRARRMILPVVVIGKASTNSTRRGYSCAASLRLTKSWISRANAADGAWPCLRTRNALTNSVRTGSGTPTAAARAT